MDFRTLKNPAGTSTRTATRTQTAATDMELGSGRLSKEKEAKKERGAMKDRKAAMSGWKGNPLLDEAGVGQSLLAPSREALPAYVGTIPLTPTPVPEHQKKPANAPAPPPKAPLYGQQPAASARLVSTPNLQESSSATMANPLLQEPSKALPSHKPTSLGGIIRPG
ncbi:hypothetical protein FA13DRAFT_816139 [Coprinellus micaceus]|uniref:Uncharacterized protein n=1 Tax=Coprinellus micaceus TaxID=71717 RepID=A0A4Y7T221_COPMI|nr:hypothetical protein FA13DRAFT_816139 [Coprinellus micaceus]